MLTMKLGRALGLGVILGVSLACGTKPTSTPENGISPIALEATLNNKFVKAGSSQTLVARINLSTDKRTSNARPPVNIALLVDTSGSMEGKAIEDARTASLALLDSLSKEDRLSVVVFHSKAEVLLHSTKIDDANMKELRQKIGAMKAQGTTDMGDGLRMAMDEVEQHLEQQGVNRVVMLGDGVPNDDRTINAITAEATNRGVSITTLGLGNDFDETLMGRVAQQSGGKFSYVEDSSKVASFFKEEVVRLHKVVARNAILELQPGPGVVVQNVIGHPMSRSDRSVNVLLGDLPLGEQHELVVELATKDAKDGSTVEALDAILRWQDAIGGAQHEERVFVGAKATTDEARITAGQDKNVNDAAARARDAAATLMKIEQQRIEQQHSQNGAPMPAPVTAAPADLDANSAAARHGAGAGTGAVAHNPVAPSPPKMSPEETRRAHQKAISNFQNF